MWADVFFVLNGLMMWLIPESSHEPNFPHIIQTCFDIAPSEASGLLVILLV